LVFPCATGERAANAPRGHLARTAVTRIRSHSDLLNG